MSRAVLLLALLASCGGPRRGQETGGEPDRLDERTTFDRRVEAELQDPPPRRRSRTSLRDAEFQLFLGIREFEDPAWEPLERQAGGGFALIQPIEGWRADLEGNLLFAVDRPQNDRPEDLRAVTVEGSAGLRLTGGGGRDLLRPFVGAGVSLLHVSLETGEFDVVSDRDFAVGAYAKAGVNLRVDSDSYVGLEVRGLTTDELDVEGLSLDGDAVSVLLLFGFRP